MFKVIEDIILLYLAYKVIFDFIIPAATTTKQVKKQFSEMQTKMQEQADKFNQQQQQQQRHTSTTYSAPTDKDDYIEFEEVK
ncbi:hypothetical protein [Ferruginibacter albus]|uniref:hypothetical protein n=1 Tax=Ferruginibacter albus TaxID=2875540 RepID=UPI001CC81F60|nr:hypothetical protein [Ferruginibacter albus]UAY52034.1 hypothetical protein K9M53_15755 [Ferruginibacter albus]